MQTVPFQYSQPQLCYCRNSVGASEGSATGSAAGSMPQRHRRPSFVPDHVKNPERYTCYDLGESITIGGGDQDLSADGGRGEMERVCHSTLDACVGMNMPLRPHPWPGNAQTCEAPLASSLAHMKYSGAGCAAWCKLCYCINPVVPERTVHVTNYSTFCVRSDRSLTR